MISTCDLCPLRMRVAAASRFGTNCTHTLVLCSALQMRAAVQASVDTEPAVLTTDKLYHCIARTQPEVSRTSEQPCMS